MYVSGFLLIHLTLIHLTLKFLLRKAAKARIDRMCKPHGTKTHLDVAEWLRNEWKTGHKDSIADVLREANFDKEIYWGWVAIYRYQMQFCFFLQLRFQNYEWYSTSLSALCFSKTLTDRMLMWVGAGQVHCHHAYHCD